MQGIEKAFHILKKITPRPLADLVRPVYHYKLAFLAAAFYFFPSRKLIMIGVTGTNGKSTVVELTHAILEEAGYKTGSVSSLRFKIGNEEKQNKLKMTMPGRFALQKFLLDCVRAGCKYAVLEVTSEGIKQYRNKFIKFDVAVMTNVTPEHIESHGSFEKYLAAKLKLFEQVSRPFAGVIARSERSLALRSGQTPQSLKDLMKSRLLPATLRSRLRLQSLAPLEMRFLTGLAMTEKGISDGLGILIVNSDDPNAQKFLAFPAKEKYVYNSSFIGIEKDGSAQKMPVTEKLLTPEGISFKLQNTTISSRLIGEFNFYNLLAAISVALPQNIKLETIKSALAKISGIPGRLEFMQKKPFAVVVDYAHTPDALRKVYTTVKQFNEFNEFNQFNELKTNQLTNSSTQKLICVLGAAGGGRDKWKRPEMGKIAAEFCDKIILTNEDPYDENPLAILEDIKRGFSSNSKSQITNSKQIQNSKFKIQNCIKMMDRREAIRHALKKANKGDIVIITGKGAEPYIMGPNNTKIPWDDRRVVKEELNNRNNNNN